MFSMGYRYGFGSGLEGSRYDSESPQGQFGYANTLQATRHKGELPYWTKEKGWREHVLLVFFERRVNKSLKVPPGDFSTRLGTVTAKLEAARQDEMRLLRERADFGYNRRDFDRLKFLDATGEFTAWATAVLNDYFFVTADCPDQMTQSWDAGQCAYRNGDVRKIFVKQLIQKVDGIGNELYPKPQD
jgi:hypothetical protein